MKNKFNLNVISDRPSWCSQQVWNDFRINGSVEACKLLLEIKDLLLQRYDSRKYFFVCMNTPLYVLLMESEIDSMLGVFSFDQMGDIKSLNLIKNEIEYGKNMTGKEPVMVDVCECSEIYDYLSEEKLDCKKVFATSISCKYPTLFSAGEKYNEVIEYIQKLPQNTGVAQRVYFKTINKGEEPFIAWGYMNPNVMKVGDNSWSDILQYRGLLYAHMGVDPVHAGMIGNFPTQRLWGIYKNYADFNYIPSVGININKDVHDRHLVKGRFKNLFEIYTSEKQDNLKFRKEVEERLFGRTNIHPIYGIFTADKDLGYMYGNLHCRISTKNLIPYITVTKGDTLVLYNIGKKYPLWDLYNFNNSEYIENSHYYEVQYHTLLPYSVVERVEYIN